MSEELPRTIENSVTGERVTFLASAEETNGEYVRIRNETSAGAPGVVMHYHLAYTEAFEVLEGSLDVCVGTKENHLVLGEGESVFVPLNTAGGNPGVYVSRARVMQQAEVLDLEEFLQIAEYLAGQGFIAEGVNNYDLFTVTLKGIAAGTS